MEPVDGQIMLDVLISGLEPDAALPVAERLRTAVAAIPFREPLRVSVGLAGRQGDGSGRAR